MDETKGTPEDESKGNSKDESKGTPKDKGKLYSDVAIAKIKSDAAAMGQGRAEKVAEQEKGALTSELQSTKSRLDALESEADESRLAEARGDPDQLRIYQREQALKKRERETEARDADIIRREGQIKSERETLDKDKGVVSIAYLAAKHGLETEELESLGISNLETLERVAEKLAKPKEPVEGEVGEEETPSGEAFVPDSGVTTGGSGGPLTDEQVAKMTPEQYAAHPSVKNRFK